MASVQLCCPGCQERFSLEGKAVFEQVYCSGCGRVLLWYYTHERRKAGPVSFERLRELASSGELKASDSVLLEGAQKWQNANLLPLSFPARSAASPPPPAPVNKQAVPANKTVPRRPAPAPDKPTAPAGAVKKAPPPVPQRPPPVSPVPDKPTPPAVSTKQAPPPAWKRILSALAAIPLATGRHVLGMFRYLGCRLRERSLKRAAAKTKLDLGQRMLAAGVGDSQLRARLATLDDQIRGVGELKGSTKVLRKERQAILRRLATSLLEQQPAAKPGVVADEYNRALAGRAALEKQRDKTVGVRRNILSLSLVGWLRVAAGYILATSLLAGVCWLVFRPPSEESPTVAGTPSPEETPARTVVSSLNHDNEIADAVGFVVCGAKAQVPNGQLVEGAVSVGTCFAVTSEGHLLTNKHVIDDVWILMHSEPALRRVRQRSKLNLVPMVWVFFRTQKYEATILHVSTKYDLAILKVDRPARTFFQLASAAEVPRGTKVGACGFPGAASMPLSDEEMLARSQQNLQALVEKTFSRRDFDYVRTDGTVSRMATEDRGIAWVQHTAPINPGNSGGPLLAEDGTVLGMNTLTAGGAQGIHMSLSLRQLKPEIETHVPGVVWK